MNKEIDKAKMRRSTQHVPRMDLTRQSVCFSRYPPSMVLLFEFFVVSYVVVCFFVLGLSPCSYVV